MISNKTEPQAFLHDGNCVAKLVPGVALFGLLRRSIEFPSLWAALVKRRSGDQHLINGGGKIDAADVEEILFARRNAVDVDCTEIGLTSSDGFQFDAIVTTKVTLVPEPGELASFQREIIGSRPHATVNDVTRYLSPTIQSTLAAFLASRSAEELFHASMMEQAAKVLHEALQGPCFAAGLSLAGPSKVELISMAYEQVMLAKEESIRRQREHEAGQSLRDAQSKAQREHLDHLSSLLTRLRGLTSDSPNTNLSELIRTFSERERGELYHALFASDVPESQTRWIVVAAGDQLLFFEPSNCREPARRLKISGAAGPVRSVQASVDGAGKPMLLLGAATGVYRLPLDHAEPDRTWVVSDGPIVRGGFNAVAATSDRIIASHSELGIWEWPLDEAEFGRELFESHVGGARTVRNLCMFEDEAYCGIDDRVISWPATNPDVKPAHIYNGMDSTITAVHPSKCGVFAGTSEGDVIHWRHNAPLSPTMIHRGMGRAVEGIVSAWTHGVQRLFYTDTSICVYSRVVEDSYACRYEAGGQTLRRVEVAPDLLVATTDLRDRLICWSPSKPDRPAASIPVASLCGHSVQDVCLV